jgi:hypothetical protein
MSAMLSATRGKLSRTAPVAGNKRLGKRLGVARPIIIVKHTNANAFVVLVLSSVGLDHLQAALSFCCARQSQETS